MRLAKCLKLNFNLNIMVMRKILILETNNLFFLNNFQNEKNRKLNKNLKFTFGFK
jgi:hypothetical protein